MDDEVLELAVDAIMAMLDRYGGLWSNDHDHVRRNLETIITVVMDLGTSDASRAEAMLRTMIGTDPVPYPE